jgi:hypothetical protein
VLALHYTLWGLFYPTTAALAAPLQVPVVALSIYVFAGRDKVGTRKKESNGFLWIA